MVQSDLLNNFQILMSTSLLNSNNNLFYSRLLGFLNKKGMKSSAKFILDSAILLVSKRLKRSRYIILLRLFFKLNTFVESRKLRIKKSTYIVPFAISLKRRLYLATKWLILSVNQNTRQISLIEKLADEMLRVLKKDSYSKSKKQKQLNNSQALANRSNIHFRW